MKKANNTANEPVCPVCNGQMRKIADTYFVCKRCKYMSSSEQSGSGAEVESVEAVREKNFKFICKIIKEKFPLAKTVLDIGCSKGHFLKVARDEGFSVTGVEPDARLAEEVSSRGFNVINDFFPQTDDHSHNKYDVIIFNDSLEHIPNLFEILHGIKTHLTDNGCAIVNIPSSDGYIFRIAYVLYKLGIKIPYERLWQKGFASPHVHYFNKRNLKKLFENNGFEMRCVYPILCYTISGLWWRIRCKSSYFVSVFTWLFFIFCYPVLAKREYVMACFSLKGELVGDEDRGVVCV